eukprot:3284613-Pleurochrysis_carterae.AAC.2
MPVHVPFDVGHGAVAQRRRDRLEHQKVDGSSPIYAGTRVYRRRGAGDADEKQRNSRPDTGARRRETARNKMTGAGGPRG